MGKLFPSAFHVLRLAALAVLAFAGFAAPALAADPDLPLAAASPLSGIGFDDKPLFLPVQKNFQMAMLTAGSELGRTCGKMEAYGWRMGPTEQARVDQIFNSTVDRFRGLGYQVEMQSPNSISHDITMFTADSAKKHFLSMWSAGEIGLVMVLCETGSSRGAHAAASQTLIAPSVQTFSTGGAAAVQQQTYNSYKSSYDKFSPVGSWVGSYVCGQGYTGGTLTISQMRGENFEGNFHFYPTAKNLSVPEGRYTVYGQYDRASQRILINPGKWVQHPADYYNTIIIGSFDPIAGTLSAYFQGITGCTSFEAKLEGKGGKTKPVAHRKHVVKHKAKKAAAVTPNEGTARTMAEPAAPAVTPPAPAIAMPAPAPAQETAPAAPTPESTSAAPAAATEKPPLAVGEPTPGTQPPAPPPAPLAVEPPPAPAPEAPAK